MKFNKSLIKSLIFFLLGGLATFSLEPYNIYPLIFCFTFAIFGISNASNFSSSILTKEVDTLKAVREWKDNF